MKTVPMIFQSETAECGLACLAMVSCYHGAEVSIAHLRELHPVSLQGLSLRHLIALGKRLCLQANSVRCEVNDLMHLNHPVLLHWNLDHFVVLSGIRNGRYIIHDPASGVRHLSAAELSRHFTGIAVEFSKANDFLPMALRKDFVLPEVLRAMRPYFGHFAQIVLLSLGVEIALLGQPFIFQKLVDAFGARLELSLFLTLIAALFASLVFSTLLTYLRSMLVLITGSSFSMGMTRQIFCHVLDLPLPYFEKRNIGQLMEQFRIMGDLENFLTGRIPASLVDGLAGTAALLLLFWLSPYLALVPLLTIGAYAWIRWLRHPRARDLTRRVQHLRGEESGFLMETLKGVFTTKINAIEQNRYLAWNHVYSEFADAQRQKSRHDFLGQAARLALQGCNFAVFISIAILLSERGLSPGTLYAALFYNTQTLARSLQLIDSLGEFAVLREKLSILRDVMEAKTEPALQAERSATRHPALRSRPTDAVLEFRSVAFGYGEGQGQILQDLDLAIQPGEFVALTGGNGAGKTTLLKLALGLYRPQEGHILFDGQCLDAMDLHELRRQIGTVTQADALLTGSVAENIASFDTELDMDRVQQVAALALIDAHIKSMPMGYNTRIGHLGSPFSEGQKQRLLLARALYRNPQLLILDEGTSNLDPANEEAILQNLRRLPIAKLLIAHRPRALELADRVIELTNGTISVRRRQSV